MPTHRRQPRALRTPAWPTWSRSGHARPPAPIRPGRQRLALTNVRSRGVARPRLAGRPSRSMARRPIGPRPVPAVTVAQRHQPGPNAPSSVGGDGRVRADGADTGRVDTSRPDRRTPDDEPRWPDTGRLDTGPPDVDPGMVDTACWTPTGRPPLWLASWQCRPRRRRPTADAGWTLRRQTPSGRTTTRTAQQQGLRGAPRCHGRAWPPSRPSAAGATPPSSWRLGALLSSE
jgi:hypothetical protein